VKSGRWCAVRGSGWLLNSFRSYYRTGDRIAVGEVIGDVVRIDVLTTTVFQVGWADTGRPGQATGALVTFPNLEVLRSNVVNFTRDFPYVWEELTVPVAGGHELGPTAKVLEDTAMEVVGEAMREAATEYIALLERARLAWDVADRPQVFAAARDGRVDLTIRYLVPAREVRRWSSRLVLAVDRALARLDRDPRVADRA
jgi:small conductance mechanosensitive channel